MTTPSPFNKIIRKLRSFYAYGKIIVKNIAGANSLRKGVLTTMRYSYPKTGTEHCLIMPLVFERGKIFYSPSSGEMLLAALCLSAEGDRGSYGGGHIPFLIAKKLAQNPRLAVYHKGLTALLGNNNNIRTYFLSGISQLRTIKIDWEEESAKELYEGLSEAE